MADTISQIWEYEYDLFHTNKKKFEFNSCFTNKIYNR